MDDERLKRGTYLTEKYFDEQLEHIREIHANVRKFYQKITDPYAKAIAYDEKMFDYGILQDAGKVTAEIVKVHVETEFEK